VLSGGRHVKKTALAARPGRAGFPRSSSSGPSPSRWPSLVLEPLRGSPARWSARTCVTGFVLALAAGCGGGEISRESIASCLREADVGVTTNTDDGFFYLYGDPSWERAGFVVSIGTTMWRCSPAIEAERELPIVPDGLSAAPAFDPGHVPAAPAPVERPRRASYLSKHTSMLSNRTP
jgi:hypothetical protein